MHWVSQHYRLLQTFDPDLPVTFHLPALTTKPSTNTIPTLFVIQGDRHCVPTSDYYFTNIQPDPIVIPPHSENNSGSTSQHAAAKDQIPQQTDTLRPGKTRFYPSILYNTIKGSAQATQAALACTTAQCNPTVKRGPDRKPKIQPLPKEKAEDKMTQTQGKDKSH